MSANTMRHPPLILATGELAASPLPLELRVPAVPVRATAGGSPVAGAELVRRLFEPLGWDVDAVEAPFGPDGTWGLAQANATSSLTAA